MYQFLHMMNKFGKQYLVIAAAALSCALQAQTPAAFNFDNAIKTSEQPQQVVLSNSAPASVEKRYYLDPMQQLFSAAELRDAYNQMGNLRVFYGSNHNATTLWEKTLALLFSDRLTTSAKCDDLSASLLMDAQPNNKIDYKNNLEGLMGTILYNDLRFCLSYLGLNYSDWELWQAYANDRVALINEVKALPLTSKRLMAFILAVDIQYTLCSQQNPSVACLMPQGLPKKDSK